MNRASGVRGWGAVLAIAAACASAGPRDEFAYSLPLEVPPGAAVVQVNVPIAVYRDSVDPRLRDVHVLNGAEEVVPFAIRRPEAARQAAPTTQRLPLFPLRGEAAATGAALQLRIDAGKTSIELEGAPPEAGEAPIAGYLVHASGVDNAIESFRFEWPEETGDFAINLVVTASDDLVQWREVARRAPLARLRHAGAVFEQRSVSFPATRAQFWRVTADSTDPLPVITAADATLVSARVPVERSWLEIAGAAVPGEPHVYQFDLAAELPIDRVELVLPDVNTVAAAQFFTRGADKDFWQMVTATSVYRMQSANGEIASPPIPADGTPARHWRIKVDPRGGGIGRGTPRLRVGWLADQLVFVTRGSGPFEVVYGNAVAVEAALPLDKLLPRDSAFANLTGDEIPAATAGSPREAGGVSRLEPPPPLTPWRKWILWLALIAGVAVLGAVALNLSRQLRQDTAG